MEGEEGEESPFVFTWLFFSKDDTEREKKKETKQRMTLSVHQMLWPQLANSTSTVLVCPDTKLMPQLVHHVTEAWYQAHESDWYIFAPPNMHKALSLGKGRRQLHTINQLEQWDGTDLLKRQGFDVPSGKVRFLPSHLFGKEEGLPPRCLYLHVNKYLVTPPTKLVIVLPATERQKLDKKLRWITKAVTQNLACRKLQVLLVVNDPNLLPKSIFRASEVLLVTGKKPHSDLYRQAHLSRVLGNRQQWEALVEQVLAHQEELLLAVVRNGGTDVSLHFLEKGS